MNHKRVIIPAICVLLVTTMAVWGCGTSISPSGNVIATLTKAMKESYAVLYFDRGLDYEDRGEHD